MAINFPNTPGNGAQHTASGITWTYDGTTWKADGVTSSYTLPTASSTVLGGIKVGSGLSINSGVLSTSGALALNNLSDVSTSGVQNNYVLKYNGSSWAPAVDSTYANSDVDTHLNQSNPTSGYVLSWNGSDYAWVAQSGGGSYANSDVDTHLNKNTANTGEVLSWNGSDYDWVAQSGGGAGTPEITWTLTANAQSDYIFSGDGFPTNQNDPTLYLIRGQTYKFVNNTGGHPFRIQSTGATVGGGTQYNSGVTNNDAGNGVTLTFVVPMDAPDTLYYQCTAHTAMFGTINVLTQGGGGTGLGSRQTFTATTASLANNVAGNVDVTAYKSYSLLKIKPSIAAWVTLYVDAASRTADANRVQGADPAPDAGVIAEVITTTANEEIKMSPGVLGWHQDGGGDAVTSVFCKVVNKSGSTGTCTVSLTVVQLEA